VHWKPEANPVNSPFLTLQEITPGEWVEVVKERVPIPTKRGTLIATRKTPTKETRAIFVTVHGFGQNRYSFHLPRYSFTAFCARSGIETWNLDLSGHGLSYPLSSLPSSIDDYIDDLVSTVKWIRKESDLPLFLLGHSLGGGVIVGSVQEIRKEIQGAVLLAGVYQFGGRNPLYKLLGDFLQKVHLLPDSTPIPIFSIGNLLSRIPFLFNLSPLEYSPVQLWYPGNLPREVIPFRLKKGFDRTTLGVLRHLCSISTKKVFLSRDENINYHEEWRTHATFPLLVLAGSKDVLLPPSDAKPAFTESPSRDKTFKVFSEREGGRPYGHVDLIQGIQAPRYVWREIVNWALSRIL